MKPNLYRQYLVDQLKVMRSTGLPVEIDWQHLRLKIRPDTEGDYFDGGQAVILKVKSRLHVVILTNHDGFMVYEDGGAPAPRKANPKNIMAIVTEPDTDTIYSRLSKLRAWKRKHSLISD